MHKRSSAPITKVALISVALYRRFVSPLFPASCRFVPTCSAFAEEAIARYGLLRGVGLVARRLLKCHPLHPGGFDPVR